MDEFLGRDLIIYILQNNLENVSVFDEKFFSGLLTIEQTAEELEAGTATVKALLAIGKLKFFRWGGVTYIFPDSVTKYKNGGKDV